MSDDNFEARIQDAIANPENMGEMGDADAVGTVGSPECGDMVRMWLKFKEENGEKVIDRASFQSFGCQTAIAVASVATKLLSGKTIEEAQNLEASDLSEPLGPLPPMKIHCGEMVEGALRDALEADNSEKHAAAAEPQPAPNAPTLVESLQEGNTPKKGKIKIVSLETEEKA